MFGQRSVLQRQSSLTSGDDLLVVKITWRLPPTWGQGYVSVVDTRRTLVIATKKSSSHAVRGFAPAIVAININAMTANLTDACRD